MRGKLAAIKLTIGKLVNIVLLTVVLVLLMYGTAQGGLNPLLEQVGGKFDEVLIMLNIKEGVDFQDCYSEKVSNLGGGGDFLDEVGVQDATFNVCRNARCNISIDGLGDFRTYSGKFEKLYGSNWTEYASVFVGGVGSVKFQKELYNAGVEILKKDIAKEIYEKGLTKQFILYGAGNTGDKPSQAIWQNGLWRVSVDGGEFETIKDDNEALDKFVNEGVDDVWDDKVYWKEILLRPGETSVIGSDYGRPIEELISDTGGKNEIDTKEDVASLKSEFNLAKARLLKEAEPSEEDINKLKEDVVGEIEVGEKTFAVDVEDGGEFPVISFTSGNEKYGLKHSGNMKTISDVKFYLGGSMKDVKLESYPISLVKWNGSEWIKVGNEDYYRLPDRYFDEAYSGTLIKQFIESKCK